MHYTFCKPFVCILLLILSTIMFMPLYGQNKNEVTISGYVTDVQTRESLIGVNIFNSSDKTGTVTNNSGYYSLTVPAGDLR
ncbi:MAG: carboxypeptidase-like regulatory domain-containing protein, partial [Porphyromonadaceae bacterium]|nr:carboxypeptidase-like regulatory domain-containing protein [Porphyromonadaceae bacterium]